MQMDHSLRYIGCVIVFLLSLQINSCLSTGVGPMVQCQLNPRQLEMKLLPARETVPEVALPSGILIPGIGYVDEVGSVTKAARLSRGQGISTAEKRSILLPPTPVQLVKPLSKKFSAKELEGLDSGKKWQPNDPSISMEWVNNNNKDRFTRRLLPGKAPARWVEYHNYSKSFATFEEVQLFDDAKGLPVAILYDESRKMLIRLDSTSVKWAAGTPADKKETTWSNLSLGYWKKV